MPNQDLSLHSPNVDDPENDDVGGLPPGDGGRDTRPTPTVRQQDACPACSRLAQTIIQSEKMRELTVWTSRFPLEREGRSQGANENIAILAILIGSRKPDKTRGNGQIVVNPQLIKPFHMDR